MCILRFNFVCLVVLVLGVVFLGGVVRRMLSCECKMRSASFSRSSTIGNSL